MKALFSKLAVFSVSVALGATAMAADAPVSFSKDIAPIFVKNCLACHGPREAKGAYQLYNFELLMKAGESGEAAIAAGKPDGSYLYSLVAETDKDVRMPKDGDPLPAEQVALIKRWIEEGAKYDAPDPKATLASIMPKAPQPDPPAAYRRPMPITAVAFNNDGKELAVGGYHEVTIWNAADGALLRRIKNVAERVYGLSYSPDGKMLAVAGGTPGVAGEVKIFDPADGKLLKDLGSMSDVCFKATFRPDGAKLAACAADRSIRIFDLASGKEERLIEDHADWVIGLAWSADGKLLASASRDKTSKVFNAENGESQATYSGHGEQVFGVAFTPDGKQVITSGGDRKIHAWNPGDGKKAAEVAGFTGEVFGLVLSGDKLFSSSADKTVQEHKVEKLAAVKKYAGLADSGFTVAYHDGAKRVAGGSFAGDVIIWNAEDGKEVAKFTAAPGYTPPATAAK